MIWKWWWFWTVGMCYQCPIKNEKIASLVNEITAECWTNNASTLRASATNTWWRKFFPHYLAFMRESERLHPQHKGTLFLVFNLDKLHVFGKRVELLVIWDALTPMWRHFDNLFSHSIIIHRHVQTNEDVARYIRGSSFCFPIPTILLDIIL